MGVHVREDTKPPMCKDCWEARTDSAPACGNHSDVPEPSRPGCEDLSDVQPRHAPACDDRSDVRTVFAFGCGDLIGGWSGVRTRVRRAFGRQNAVRTRCLRLSFSGMRFARHGEWPAQLHKNPQSPYGERHSWDSSSPERKAGPGVSTLLGSGAWGRGIVGRRVGCDLASQLRKANSRGFAALPADSAGPPPWP